MKRKRITIGQLKAVAILMCMAVTFYPVMELSRCIIAYNIIGGWQPGWQGAYLADFWAELGFIWLGYLVMPFIVNWFIDIVIKTIRAGGIR